MTGYRPGIRRNWRSVSILVLVLLAWTFHTAGVERLLGLLFPNTQRLVYDRTPMWRFLLDHLVLVAIGGAMAVVIGTAAGLLVMSPAGRPFRDVVLRIGNFGQAIPSVAIMAIAVPAVGYGSEPVLLALVIYSILPVMVNVVAGISGVPEAVVEAGRGMGMTRTERLTQLELPLAMPVIMTGIRTMLVILVSAATLGAVVGAGGLGVPIMSGIGAFNNSIVAHGAVPAILLALVIDRAL
ncbi:MAG: ABC transporter permease [Thermoleophilia bacterium]|nr:ABC transporter permease [Thermoleophilia bacterium]